VEMFYTRHLIEDKTLVVVLSKVFGASIISCNNLIVCSKIRIRTVNNILASFFIPAIIAEIENNKL